MPFGQDAGAGNSGAPLAGTILSCIISRGCRIPGRAKFARNSRGRIDLTFVRIDTAVSNSSMGGVNMSSVVELTINQRGHDANIILNLKNVGIRNQYVDVAIACRINGKDINATRLNNSIDVSTGSKVLRFESSERPHAIWAGPELLGYDGIGQQLWADKIEPGVDAFSFSYIGLRIAAGGTDTIQLSVSDVPASALQQFAVFLGVVAAVCFVTIFIAKRRRKRESFYWVDTRGIKTRIKQTKGTWRQDALTPLQRKSLVSIRLPTGITKIGDNAFHDCARLKKVEFPLGLSTIGRWAFKGCSHLAELKLPIGLTKIENHAFADCVGLKQLKLPRFVSEIGECAFVECRGLTQLDIRSDIDNIGKLAFAGVDNLVRLRLVGTDLSDAVIEALHNCIAPYGLVVGADVDKDRFGQFAIVPKESGWMRNEEGDATELPTSSGAWKKKTLSDHTRKTLVALSLPPGIKSIKKGAFTGCTRLRLLEIPGAVEVNPEDKIFDGLHITRLELSGTKLGVDVESVERGLTKDAQVVNLALAGQKFGKFTIVPL
jgi:hypothetical protein